MSQNLTKVYRDTSAETMILDGSGEVWVGRWQGWGGGTLAWRTGTEDEVRNIKEKELHFLHEVIF